MSGVNKAIIVGRLGRDPEIRYTQNQSAVANIAVATSEKWKDKNTGETNEKTEWHRVVAFGRLAEIMGEYLKKGSQVYIEGRLQTRKWQDKEGHDRYTTEIVANEMQMLGAPGGNRSTTQTDNGLDDDGAGEPQAPAAAAKPTASKPQPRPAGGNRPQGGAPANNGARKPATAAAGGGDFDDDIPFARLPYHAGG